MQTLGSWDRCTFSLLRRGGHEQGMISYRTIGGPRIVTAANENVGGIRKRAPPFLISQRRPDRHPASHRQFSEPHQQSTRATTASIAHAGLLTLQYSSLWNYYSVTARSVQLWTYPNCL